MCGAIRRDRLSRPAARRAQSRARRSTPASPWSCRRRASRRDSRCSRTFSFPSFAARGGCRGRRCGGGPSEILADLGQEHALPLDAEARDLSAAQRQLVEIAKALALKANLIIFDEPTASLSPSEVERLFDVIARLESAQCAIVFVSHRLEEVFAISEEITVMREGRTVAASRPTSSLNQTELIRLMVGRDIGSIYSAPAAPRTARANPVLSVRGLRAPPLVRDVSFDLHRGEILGLGGLVGAGRSETVETLFGLRPRGGGEVRFEGRPFAPRAPAEAIRAGIGFVAEDRRRQSIVPDLSVRENLLLGHLGAHRGFGLGYGRLDRKIAELMARLELPPERLADPSLLNFSGGMQQKIIIARWLLLEPKVLILDEPTKGVDIGTRASIYAILRDIAATGAAILIVSSEFEELLGLADRVIVISDGASIADIPSAYLDEEKLTLLAAPRSLDGALSAPVAGTRRPMRRRGLLGDPRRRAGLLPQRSDRECERGSSPCTRGTRRVSRRRRSEPRCRRARPISCSIRRAGSRASWSMSAAIAAMSSGRLASSSGRTLLRRPPRRCAWRSRNDSGRRYEPGCRSPDERHRSETRSDAARAPPRRFSLRSAPLELRMLALAIVIAVALSLLSPYFLKTNNLLNLLDQSVVVGIVSIGMTFVILTGGIDLSVGSLVGLTGVILGLSLHHFPIPVAIALSVFSGAGIGLVFGTVDRLFRPRRLRDHARRHGDRQEPRVHLLWPDLDQRHPPATQRSRLHDHARRADECLDAARALRARLGIPDLHQGRAHDLCGRLQSRGGPHGRPRCAVLQRTALCGLGALSAVAATLMSSQILSIDPLAGTGLELDAIAAVVIGGASLYGGRARSSAR